MKNALMSPLDITPADQEIFHQVDEAIIESLEERNPTPALQFGLSLRKTMQLRGLALAKLLAKIHMNWYEFDVDDSPFNVIETEMGVPKSTAQPYIRTWNALENAAMEEATRERLYGKPIEWLYLLTGAAREGQMDGHWEEAAEAGSKQEVQELVRELRGEQTSAKVAVTIFLDEDGTLKARRGKGRFVPFGYINLDAEGEIAEIAINRIVRAAGIIDGREE